MNYILALVMIVGLGGAGSAAADDRELNWERSAPERSHELKTKVAELGYDVRNLEQVLAITEDLLKRQGWRITLSASDQGRGLKLTFKKIEE